MSKKDEVANKYLISNKVIRIYNILFWILALQIVIGSYFCLIDSTIYISFQIGISILLISIKIIDNIFRGLMQKPHVENLQLKMDLI